MQQQDLIHEDWRDALRHTVKALGGFETVGEQLWPGKLRKAAGAWLSDCLNPERPAKLDLEELQHLMRLARDRGVHLPMHYLCDDLGYGHPPPVEPLDQEAEVVRQMDQTFQKAEQLLRRYERISAGRTVQAVSKIAKTG